MVILCCVAVWIDKVEYRRWAEISREMPTTENKSYNNSEHTGRTLRLQHDIWMWLRVYNSICSRNRQLDPRRHGTNSPGGQKSRAFRISSVPHLALVNCRMYILLPNSIFPSLLKSLLLFVRLDYSFRVCADRVVYFASKLSYKPTTTSICRVEV